MKEKLLEILIEVEEEVASYDGDDMLRDSIIDSIQLMDIVAEIEEQFDIMLDAKYIVRENFKTVNSIEKLIKRIMD